MSAKPTGGSHFARTRARRAALQALYQWQLSAEAPAEIERQFAEGESLRKVDREYFSALLRGVCTEVDALDQILEPAVDRPLGQVDPVERAILRIGAYELAFRVDTPWRVVVNEAVELAKMFGGEQGHRFVNGTLDQVARRVRPDVT